LLNVKLAVRTVLYCTVLYCTVLCCAVLCCAVLYCTVLYCTVLYCTVLCCAVLCCAVLCCAVLYCTVLYCTYCNHWTFNRKLCINGRPVTLSRPRDLLVQSATWSCVTIQLTCVLRTASTTLFTPWSRHPNSPPHRIILHASRCSVAFLCSKRRTTLPFHPQLTPN